MIAQNDKKLLLKAPCTVDVRTGYEKETRIQESVLAYSGRGSTLRNKAETLGKMFIGPKFGLINFTL